MPGIVRSPQDYVSKIFQTTGVDEKRVAATIAHLVDGGTVPFIARYRKEATGGLDEVQITQVRDELQRLIELDKRRETILKSITEQGKLTKELQAKIRAAATMTALEDLYLPYRPKRRTRAMIAKEKGLEPLAKIIFAQGAGDPLKLAAPFVDEKKKVASAEEALAGARDIIAEWVNEDIQARQKLREYFHQQAILSSKVAKGKDVEGIKYKDYFEFNQLASKVPSHRMLAIRRGEHEKILSMSIQPPAEGAMALLEKMFVKADNQNGQQVKLAVTDSYNRLLSLSLETDIRLELKKRADAEAIETFKKNLRELLMAPPLGAKNILAIDPGIRTGCKVVCLDQQGKLLADGVIYISASEEKRESAKKTIKELCKKFTISVIAIGNGTAGRETEEFIKVVGLPKEILVLLVDESGASIYSASEVAREEFPDHDVTVRGAVSIGRRLMDPLAELVKIDPKSIGVGQYQHDVDQKLLKASLDDVIIHCVNQVGVEINSASKQLLSYVAGVGPTRAGAIVAYRNKNGAFGSRKEFNDVAGFGPKVFEQAAGFLRIHNAKNPLDASAVHPESYAVVTSMAKDLKCDVAQLMKEDALRQKIKLERYISASFGLPTLTDIMEELAKPGRDPREPFSVFTFKEDLRSIDDIAVGMELPGVITNVTNFGAFVDIGIHQPGLVHISQLADRYVSDPHQIVKVHQKVMVKVMAIDAQRGRIELSMRRSQTEKTKKQNSKNFSYQPFKDLR